MLHLLNVADREAQIRFLKEQEEDMLAPADLQEFTGTEMCYRHPLNYNMLYTDGVKHFAEEASAYWFLDIVATEIFPLLAKEPFMALKMIVVNSQADIIADDGNDSVVYTRHIDYTDCPLGTWLFYLTDGVLLLRTEY